MSSEIVVSWSRVLAGVVLSIICCANISGANLPAFAQQGKNESIEQVLLRGFHEARFGQESKALNCYRMAAQMKPSAVFEINYNLVRELSQRQEFAAATKFVQKVRLLKPSAPDADVLTGIIQIEDDHPELAKISFSSALAAKKQEEPSPLVFAARGYLQMGDFEQAHKVLNLVDKHWPNTPLTNLGRGMCFLTQKKYKEAQPYLRKAYKFQKLSQTLVLLMAADCRLADWQGAVKDSDNCSRDAPNSMMIKILMDRADALRELKRYEEAAKEYTAAMRIRDSNKAYLMRALCYEKLGRVREANEDRKHAAEVYDDLRPTAPIKRI